ncbi:MAG TPA: bacterial Ig-like domain-containing protein [Candidatus Limihabitans stercoravium]|nr:bacterial Ig-like domain-containing protein [Candidatus Limihabitans stercoravium]
MDTSNLLVVLMSENKQLRYLSGDEYTVEGFDSSKAGSVTLIVRYGEFTTQYTVTVKELPPERPSYLSLEIYIMPTKTVYNIGENLNVDGGYLKINYTDGTYDIVELLYLMTYGFSSDVAGTVTVNVKYLNMYTSFEVTVVDPEQSN